MEKNEIRRLVTLDEIIENPEGFEREGSLLVPKKEGFDGLVGQDYNALSSDDLRELKINVQESPAVRAEGSCCSIDLSKMLVGNISMVERNDQKGSLNVELGYSKVHEVSVSKESSGSHPVEDFSAYLHLDGADVGGIHAFGCGLGIYGENSKLGSLQYLDSEVESLYMKNFKLGYLSITGSKSIDSYGGIHLSGGEITGFVEICCNTFNMPLNSMESSLFNFPDKDDFDFDPTISLENLTIGKNAGFFLNGGNKRLNFSGTTFNGLFTTDAPFLFDDETRALRYKGTTPTVRRDDEGYVRWSH